MKGKEDMNGRGDRRRWKIEGDIDVTQRGRFKGKEELDKKGRVERWERDREKRKDETKQER